MSRKNLSEKNKRVIRERAMNCCEYCQSIDDIATQRFLIEHIIPLAKNGTNNLDNLAYACNGCNGHKYQKIGGKDPFTDEFTPLFHPRQHQWTDHFTWSKDFLKIVGLTAIGRTSVKVLRLNRPRLVRRREILYLVNLHPPGHTIL